MSMPRPLRIYTRAEYVSDAVVHLAALAAAAAAVPVLIVLAVMLRGDAAAVTGVAVYGTTLILMILCSALYNMIERPDWSGLLRRLDHAAIYLKIAGTYTPFVAVSGHGVGLLAGLWGAALAGIALRAFSPTRFRALAIALGLGMGWAGLAAGGALLAALPTSVVVLMLVGGALYTAGVIFHLWEALRFHNTIWHVFVMAATFVFYAAVTVLVVSVT